jgi:hypothetical protein
VLFLKDQDAIQRRNADIRTEERLDSMESEIHKLRAIVEELVKNQKTERA